MCPYSSIVWAEKVVDPEVVLRTIRPGMNVFLSTGAAEPRTLVRRLMSSKASNLQDLELIQLVSFGEAICPEEICLKKYS